MGWKARFPAKAGEHKVGISFVRRFWEPEGVLQPPQTGFARSTNEYYHGDPAVEIVLIGGPYTLPPATTRLPAANYSSAIRQERCRGTVREEDLVDARHSSLPAASYGPGRAHADELLQGGPGGSDFQRGIQQGVERILASPSFLFRIEHEPANMMAGVGLPSRANSIWLPACRSFCGAASRTTNCWMRLFTGS